MIAETDKSKRALRLTLKAELLAIGTERRRELSAAVSRTLLAQPCVANASVVLLFMPRPHEPDLSSLARALLESGVCVCLPRIDFKNGTFEPARITSVDEGLETHRYDVPEPPQDAPRIDPADLDTVLTPGLAFDRAGNRLGHGAGMYDRFLSDRSVVAWVCGVGFESQLVARLPTGPNDQRLDAVATDRRLLLFPGRQGHERD